jgi:hypothetical protein
MATMVHRPLKVLAFNANGIGRQRYELSKQLQDLHVYVTLFTETRLIWNLMRGSLFQISTFTEPTATLTEKAELPLQLEKAFPTTM